MGGERDQSTFYAYVELYKKRTEGFFVRQENLKMYMRCQVNEIKALWIDNKTRNCTARL